MPKAPGSRQPPQRHNPLSEDYLASAPLKQKSNKRKKSHISGADENPYVDSKASRKILKIGQDLAEEAEAENAVSRPQAPNPAFALDRAFEGDVGSEEEMGEFDDEPWGEGEEEVVEEVELDLQDLAAWERFNPSFDPSTLLQPKTDEHGDEDGEEEGEGQGTNLADLILEKIAAHEAAQAAVQDGQPMRIERDIRGDGPPEDAVELPAKVVEVYTQVGLILSRYKSGPLPKPFKILPTLPQWDIILSITRPDSWTPNACYEATRLFTSSRPALAQAFLNEILLPTVRHDISETRKLNVHLYKALKKSLYKPAAFFKGFLFPLVASGSCTLREAHIVGSVLARVSVPVLHSAAALQRLCEMAAEQMGADAEAAGAANVFIRVLLEKKYALPYKVVDSLVFHFLRFRAVDPSAAVDARMTGVAGGPAAGRQRESGEYGKLPVLWHQCLLSFAQRYRNDITEDQREALLDLLLVRGHKAIGPEVRRELLEGRGRGVVVGDGVGMEGGDDTMMS
ncbi:snoRNA-binding rRNA-processing protein [Elasticomyces elasticus]|nr:snoRNA-binding rRNA-processing protein [Elasticomyces elasticus]